MTFPILGQALPRVDFDKNYATQLFTSGSFFKTNANFDSSGGSYTELQGQRTYQLIESRLGFEHFLNQNFSLISEVGAAYAISDDEITVRSTTEATDALIGVRFLANLLHFDLMTQAWFLYPFNSFSSDTDQVMSGEGVIKAHASAQIQKSFGNWQPHLSFGYLHQDQGRSGLATGSLGLYWKAPILKLGARVFGTETLVSDLDSNNQAERLATSQRVNAGSLHFYGINSEFKATEISITTDLNPSWRLEAIWQKPFAGQSISYGWTGLLSLQYFFNQDLLSPNSVDPISVTPDDVIQNSSEPAQQFVPEKPQYDESVFKEALPKIRKKRLVTLPGQKSKKVKKTKKIDIDKSLEDVQKTLEP